MVSYIDRENVCDSCREEYCSECDECGEWHLDCRMRDAYRDGEEVRICSDCRDELYYCCDRCGDLHHRDDMRVVYRADGCEDYICEDCADHFDTCPHCDELIEVCGDGTCPRCGAVIEEREEAV